ncbi:MAG: methylated-DNA--[protein]-cysteine S-methyltransferase [Gemmatimonadaceae bacterium]|nr:methylated-DNA--[protein]-cysteine S-methyltransferase [Gemmatimonadaceae bacterium]
MSRATQDYERVTAAIRYLEGASPHQPSLHELAAHVGLSEFHVQRLFTRWAGISPKRFMQVQTLHHAKEALDGARSVLDGTYTAGLSSAGRLHDLFVNLEAVTPGEYRSGGQGVRIDAGFHDTPFGECLVAVTERGICGLSFVEGDRDAGWADLEQRWPAAVVTESRARTSGLVSAIFEPLRGRARRPLALLVRGTNFQVQVWSALLRIPPGRFAAYEDIAHAISAPRAVRAVGTAVGRNPVAFLIPCHRVIRASGAIGGYRWGLPRKRAMIAWEAGRRAS